MLKSIFAIKRKLMMVSLTLSCSAHDLETDVSANVVSPESYEGHSCNLFNIQGLYSHV